MDRLERGYVAGLYEGEGCITAGGKNSSGNYRSPRLRISMKDREPLERAFRYSGVGTIQGPRYYGSSPRPVFTWQVSRVHQIVSLLSELYPYLSPRRKAQIKTVLEKCEKEYLWPR